ncbi:MAG: penicillin-insensitive murein endopeptidase [Deltaproteobacteria bacterium]|nr:penicillin-insensitive murein endopeptidase [Deltaproteobacteria bacterium]
MLRRHLVSTWGVTAIAAVGLTACAELGVVSDGTSISVGKPSKGYIIDGARIPDKGEGFFTREVWQQRGVRYGTDEMVDLLTGVARRMYEKVNRETRIVIADISKKGGGPAEQWHRSHQAGRDVDLLFYVRDARGKPMEPDLMRLFDKAPDERLLAKDGSGITIDVPRTWLFVKELVTAHEAAVQWIFVYEAIAVKLVEYGTSINEPEAIIQRVRNTLLQPKDAMRHDDHMHVRLYCTPEDRRLGCRDIGSMANLEEREQEHAAMGGAILAAMGGALPALTTGVPAAGTAKVSAAASRPNPASLRALGRFVYTHLDRFQLRR